MWRITIPEWHPTRLNHMIGCHWAKGHRLKKADRTAISAWTWGLHIPPATGPRRVRLTITLGPHQRAGDPDAYWKSLLDALVHCKLLVDDNRQHVRLDPIEFTRGKSPETTIELEDIC